MDIVQARFFKLCIIINLLWVHQLHTSFDDLVPVSSSQVCQNYKLQIMFRFVSAIVKTLYGSYIR